MNNKNVPTANIAENACSNRDVNLSPSYILGLVHRVEWPIDFPGEPVLFEGREGVDKPLNIRIKEGLWLSIEHHCAKLGLSKTEWIRIAMLKQLNTEQQWFICKAYRNSITKT